jgi:MoaA/NifB/PqqE/SkfB family radical SAM enzyme
MASHPAMFIAFPGDEEQYDGCLAAGRGFMHINPSGKVEPCPFAPFSDTDLHFNTLREALSSEFLAKVRKNHHLLKEGKGGCALWANREWLRNL